jgi:hypothetical protein
MIKKMATLALTTIPLAMAGIAAPQMDGMMGVAEYMVPQSMGEGR